MKIRVLGLIGLLVSLLLALTTWAYAHPGEIAHCNKDIKAKSIKFLGDKRLQNGMYAEFYDTDGDGKINVTSWSTVYGVERVKTKKGKERIKVLHDPFPTFYLVDLNADGFTDRMYVDTLGVGNCQDIVLYEDLRAPGKHGGVVGGYVSE